MNAVHLNTYTEGGAAEAALRIHQALPGQGISSRFIALYKAGCTTEKVEDFRNNIGAFGKWSGKLFNKLQTMRYHSALKKTGEPFGPLKSVWNLFSHPVILQSDIAHLHWIDHYVNIPRFFDLYKGRIVWTFHDHFPFSGGFHYPPPVPDVMWERKALEQKKVLHRLFSERPIDIVFPSHHLKELAGESGILGLCRLHVIKNPIDTEQFKPLDKKACREKWGIAPGEKAMLFAADHLHYKRKGLHLLWKALENNEFPGVLIAAGRGKLPDKIGKTRVVYAGHVREKHLLAELYNAADLLVNPSINDISSNTVIEAMACGLAAAVLPVGGIPELISPVNGIVAGDKTADELWKAIEKAFCNTFDAHAIRQKAIAEHSTIVAGQQYAAVYRASGWQNTN